MATNINYMHAANCSKSGWGKLIQVFQDPEINSTQKKHLVLMLYEQDEDWLFDHHNDMPKQLISYACKYGAKTVFFQSKSNYSILHHAVLNSKPDHIIINMIDLGGKSLLTTKDKGSNGHNALHVACLQEVSLKVLMKMIERGGRDVLLARDNHGVTALHLILQTQKDNAVVIRKLVEIELKMIKYDNKGRAWNSIFKAVLQELGLSILHLILRIDKQNYNLIKKIVDIGGRKLIMKKCPSGWNGLCSAFICNAPSNVIFLLLNIGGKDLLLEENNTGSTILERIILMRSDEENLISEIVRIGGRELINVRIDGGLSILELLLRTRAKYCTDIVKTIMDIAGEEIISNTDKSGWNCLHIACLYNAPIEIIELLLQFGGNDMVMKRDKYGSTPLLLLSSFENVSVMQKLAEVGGKELLMIQNYAGSNILHKVCAAKNGDVTNFIKMLLEVGGKDLALSKTSCPGFFAGWTALHYLCLKQAPTQTISALIDAGEAEILNTTNSLGKIPLHQIIDLTYSPHQTHTCSIIKLLIEKGIEYNIGGEYSFGGLFLTRKDEIYSKQNSLFNSVIDDGKWKDLILPILAKIDKKQASLPILQSVITSGRASAQIISDIIENFRGSAGRKNRQGCVPLDIAIREGLQWQRGTKLILEAFADESARPKLNIGCEYGLKWINGMNEVLLMDMKNLGVCDEQKGLYPFMLAAAGEGRNDVDVIFETMRRTQNTFMS